MTLKRDYEAVTCDSIFYLHEEGMIKKCCPVEWRDRFRPEMNIVAQQIVLKMGLFVETYSLDLFKRKNKIKENHFFVSTKFTGLSSTDSDGKESLDLWETRVYNHTDQRSELDELVVRWKSERDAIKGHSSLIGKVKKILRDRPE